MTPKEKLWLVMTGIKPDITKEEFDELWEEYQTDSMNHFLDLSNDIIELHPTLDSQGNIQ